MKIATILTCYNRKTKTLSCLEHIYLAANKYNGAVSGENNKIEISVFLTDDGCTDGTAEDVTNYCQDKFPITVVKGTGSLYWAGGMRLAWNEAMKHAMNWDYYLLMNDDTDIDENGFITLIDDEEYSKKKYEKLAAISGITTDKNNRSKYTYGGRRFTNRFFGNSVELGYTGTPQECDLFNANILLIPAVIVDSVGIFYKKYVHAHADGDYAQMVLRAGYPALVSSKVCGYCEYDHLRDSDLASKICKMTIRKRRAYYNNPIHTYKDYLVFIRRTSPFRYPIVWCASKLLIYMPGVYYGFSRIIR